MSLERESRSWRPKKLTISMATGAARVLGSATGFEALRSSIRQKKDWVETVVAPIAQVAFPLIEGRNISLQDGKVPIFGNSTRSRILKTLVDVGVDASIMIAITTDTSHLVLWLLGAKAAYNVGVAVLLEVINTATRKSNKSVINK